MLFYGAGYFIKNTTENTLLTQEIYVFGALSVNDQYRRLIVRKIMKIALCVCCIFLGLALSGCGSWGRAVAKVMGSSESCIDGVIYIQFTSGVTVKYNQDGTIATCK